MQKDKHYIFSKISSLSLAVLCLLALLLSACTQNTTHQTYEGLDPLTLHSSLQPSFSNPRCPYIENDSGYRVGAEDKIKVVIFNEKDLSGEYTINNSGALNLPLIPEVNLSGCTTKQIETILFEEFTQGYLVNPSIAINIAKYRPFYVIGEVKEPGRYDYTLGMNSLEAVAMAGGFTYRANKKIAKILTGRHNGQAIYKDLRLEREITPGDIIIIKERYF